MGANLLVVEDDEAIRDSLKGLFHDELPDLNVLTACNGREALDVLESGLSPCLVLLDLLMPVMNGLEFLDAVRAREDVPMPPVVLVSAYVKQYQDVNYPGIVGMLPKPFRVADLLEAVARHCHVTLREAPAS